jgi:ubiquinone/menaquinone biosynthesis C-methylase UbiE
LDSYVHGYSATEENRLSHQAGILAGFIHAASTFAPGSRILEPGCGTGEQTVQLAARNPHTTFVAIDRSEQSLQVTAQRIAALGLSNVELRVADVCALPFAAGELDGAFVCFLLEHLRAREQALREIRRVLKAGAPVHVFEGDNGSAHGWPDDPAISRLVEAVSAQHRLQGGDPCIGRGLYAVLAAAGFDNVSVEPCVAYADGSRRRWTEEFTKATFIAMMKGQRDATLECGLLTAREWGEGMDALERTTAADGSFCYTFFRATARR